MSTPDQIPRLAYTLHETAQALGLSYVTVFRLVRTGRLRTCQVWAGLKRSAHLVPKSELERFLQEGLNQSELKHHPAPTHPVSPANP